MIAVAVAHRRSFDGPRLPHKCQACEGREGRAKRKEWGCKRKSAGKYPQLVIPCPFCLGVGCRECRSEDPDMAGMHAIWRCPLAVLDSGAAEARLLHRAYPAALPFAGGICEQPAVYVAAMRVLDHAEGLMQELEHEEAQQPERRPDGRGK